MNWDNQALGRLWRQIDGSTAPSAFLAVTVSSQLGGGKSWKARRRFRGDDGCTAVDACVAPCQPPTQLRHGWSSCLWTAGPEITEDIRGQVHSC